MGYNETKQKLILREMESDLLAIVAIDAETDDYEVIYTDGAYREFANGYRNEGFFPVWLERGIPLVHGPDRERMAREISKDFLLERLSGGSPYYTVCRFDIGGRPTYCRIKVARDVVEPGNIVLSFRNIDGETRSDGERLAQMEELHRRERDVAELTERLGRMRMRNFASQMHPHFLYNALGSIREVVLTDPEYGADLLYDFTTHLRASIRAMGSDEAIPFGQELENIEAYVRIERMRFGDRLNVVYDIGPRDFEIIPLGVQPLVENAIKHGLFERGAAGGAVALRTREARDAWLVEVEDLG